MRWQLAFVVLLVLFAAPAFAQNITSVVETGGDAEATDTIVAQWTGQTFTVSVAGEPFPGAVVGNPYTVGTFGHLAPTFVDRAHALLKPFACFNPSWIRHTGLFGRPGIHHVGQRQSR